MPVMIATLERGGTNFDISSPAISSFSLGSTQTMHERWLAGASVETQTTRTPLFSAASISGVMASGFPGEHKPRYECAFRWRVSALPGSAGSQSFWQYRALAGAFYR